MSALRLLDTALFRAELRTRMPFRYGIATLTQLPHVFLRAEVEIDGKLHAGIAADHLPPKWFTKDPARDPLAEIDEMLAVINRARQHARAIDAPTPFAFWRELYERQAAWARAEKIPPLLAHFGVSLVERAVIDAFCRARGRPFHALLRANAFGVELGAVHPELAGSAPADWLPAAPRDRAFLRHTVGLSDPLEEADIAAPDRVSDGLPQSLEACIARYGLRHFKLKLNADPARDLDRLRSIAALLARHAPPDFAVSLDGNESFQTVAAFRAEWETMRADPALRPLCERLLFVEQPFHRDIALGAEVGRALRAWPERPPFIIDESDADLTSLPAALRLGYAGTSHKNCKGVFKGVAHACLLAHLRRADPARRLILSGEDLSNIGPVALLQDLAVQAALGVTSIERNGHHYFSGLSFWPAEIQAQMLADHDDLYTRSAAGWPTLRVARGEISLRSVNAAPFGIAALPPLSNVPRAG